MKRFLAVLLMLCLLCACNAEPSESSESMPESSSSSVSRSFPELPSSFSFSFQSEAYSPSAFADDPSVTYLGMADNVEIYKRAVKTDETRLDIVYGKDGVFNTTTEVPATEYWIIDSEGNLLIEQPFYDCKIMEAGSWGSLDQRYPTLYGNYKGSFFYYIWNNGKYELEKTEQAGEISYNNIQDESLFGYKRTQYCYGSSYLNILYGLNDKDGNVILEPVFSYYITVPFEDRFTAATNNVGRVDGWESFESLLDADGNILATYNTINFHFFDDGSYIGIAWYPGYGEDWGNVLICNETGEILERGHRFIDKDGNELSPCFNLFALCGNTDEFIETYLEGTVTVPNSAGEEITIRVSDYICEP